MFEKEKKRKEIEKKPKTKPVNQPRPAQPTLSSPRGPSSLLLTPRGPHHSPALSRKAQHHPQPASPSHPASRPRPTSQPHLLAMDARAFLSRHSLTDTAHLSSRSSSLNATPARDHGHDSRRTFPGSASPRSPDSPFKQIRDPPDTIPPNLCPKP